MAKGKIKNIRLLNDQGFTLMEVMIAISIFAIFASVFVTGQGYNLLDSSSLKDEILLKDICENKII
jgi:prepilin-type N-terminal cleavage/methylation domain-containing protein